MCSKLIIIITKIIKFYVCYIQLQNLFLSNMFYISRGIAAEFVVKPEYLEIYQILVKFWVTTFGITTEIYIPFNVMSLKKKHKIAV